MNLFSNNKTEDKNTTNFIDKVNDTYNNIYEKVTSRGFVTFAKILGMVMLFCGSMGLTLYSLDKIADNKVGVKIITISKINEEKTVVGPQFAMEANKIDYKEMVNAKEEQSEIANLERTDRDVDQVLLAQIQSENQQKQEDALALAADRMDAKDEADARIATREKIAAMAKAREDAAAALEASRQAAINGTLVDGSTLDPSAYDSATAQEIIQAALTNNVGDSGITYTLTGYCPCSKCCGKWSNPSNPTTSSGTRATAGRTIAADTGIYPYGTQISINGHVFTVEDTGSAINGYHFDIYFNTHEEAVQFAKRYSTNVQRLN